MMITGTKANNYNGMDITVDMKKDFWISETNGTINVLTKNAAHAAYKGMGRFFDSWEDALNAYKSSEAKAAIQYAMEILN